MSCYYVTRRSGAAWHVRVATLSLGALRAVPALSTELQALREPSSVRSSAQGSPYAWVQPNTRRPFVAAQPALRLRRRASGSDRSGTEARWVARDVIGGLDRLEQLAARPSIVDRPKQCIRLQDPHPALDRFEKARLAGQLVSQGQDVQCRQVRLHPMVQRRDVSRPAGVAQQRTASSPVAAR